MLTVKRIAKRCLGPCHDIRWVNEQGLCGPCSEGKTLPWLKKPKPQIKIKRKPPVNVEASRWWVTCRECGRQKQTSTNPETRLSKMRCETCKRREMEIGTPDLPLDSEPTNAAPGTAAKTAVMMRRAASGLAIFHPGDNLYRPEKHHPHCVSESEEL